MNERTQHVIDMYKQIIMKDIAPPVDCCVCGKQLVTFGHEAVNTIPKLHFGVPGTAQVEGIECPIGERTEHWTCGDLACVRQATITCLDEHLLPILQAIHERLAHPSIKPPFNPYPNAAKEKDNGDSTDTLRDQTASS